MARGLFLRRDALRISGYSVMATTLAAIVMALAASPSGAIDWTYYCNSGGTRSLAAYGNQPDDRCAVWYNTIYRNVVNNEHGYWVCAAFKPGPLGGGADQITPADCNPGTAVVETPGLFSPRATYATIINKQGAAHSGFRGAGYYTG